MSRENKPFQNGLVILPFVFCILLLILLSQSVAGLQTQQSTEESGGAGAQVSEEQQENTGGLQAGMQEIAEWLEKWKQNDQENDSDEYLNSGENSPDAEGVPETYEFTISDQAYFDDALFIGDSRTVGLREYGTLNNADYFASSGLNIYTLSGTRIDVGELTGITLSELLQQKSYGKIYIMLGINELGYDFERTVEKYKELIETLQEMQPEAILYVCANLHVNSVRDEYDEIHNNEAIDRMNQAISEFADQKEIFYLNVNPLFDDENGNLAQEYISDDSHVMGVYYETWCNWYRENTIVK